MLETTKKVDQCLFLAETPQMYGSISEKSRLTFREGQTEAVTHTRGEKTRQTHAESAQLLTR